MAKLRILLADDHTLLRQGMRRILEERTDWEIVGETADGRAAVQQALALEPDVVILDIGMPQLNGIDATAQIVRRQPSAQVLIVSMHGDESFVSRAVKAGARGYLLKEAAGDELLAAVAAVAAGKSYFSPAVARIVLDDYAKSLTGKGLEDRYEALSEREREIFQLVAEGRSTKEVAELLSVSPATVDTHRAHILQKLDIHSTAALVLYAVRRGVIA